MAAKKELNKMIWVMFPMLLGPLLNLVLAISISHVSGVAQFGTYSLVMSIAAIAVGYSDLGMRDFFLSKSGIQKEYSSALTLLFLSFFVYLIICLVSLGYIVGSLRENSLAVCLLVALLIEAFATGVLQKSIYYLYQKNDRLTEFSRVEIYAKVIPLLLKILFLFLLSTLTMPIYLGALSCLIFYGTWLFYVSSSIYISPAHKIEITIRHLLIFLRDWKTWSFYTLSFLSLFLYFGMDRIVIESVLGASELAIYASASVFLALGQIIVGGIWSLYMPRLSRGERFYGYNSAVYYLAIIGVSVVIFYQFFSYYIFEYIYPAEYAYGKYVLSISSLYYIFRMPNVFFEIKFLLIGKYNQFVRLRLFFGIGYILSSIVILPIAGILGNAVLLVISEALLTLSLISYRRRIFN